MSDRGDIRHDREPPDMVVLDRDRRAPRRARGWLERLYRAELSERTLEDAKLILSELVTNALRHGLGDVVVRVTLDADDCLMLAVTDSGDGHPHVLPVDPERIGGVGLTIVERLAASWGVAAFPGGKTVWATLGTTPTIHEPSFTSGPIGPDVKDRTG